MSDPLALAAVLLRHSSTSFADVSPEWVGGLLASLWEQARASWPGVEVAAEDFTRHLAERLPAGPDLETALTSRCSTDLYLACACATCAPQALALFDRHLLAQVPAFLHQMRPSATMLDEVQQILRERLFVAAPGARPKIADYSGSGPLGGWLRIMALRVLLDQRRHKEERRAQQGRGDSLLGRMARSEDNVEIAHLKARYRDNVETALRDALRVLDAEERAVLQLHFLDGLSFDQLAKVLHLSRATAVRKVKAARTAILAQVKRLLADRLQLAPSEIQSMVRLVQSQIDERIVRSLIQERAQ